MNAVMKSLENAALKSQTFSWALLRILSSAMFMTHGYAKLFGENPQTMFGGMDFFGINLGINMLWIAAIILVDICYNVLPALKNAHDEPMPFLSINLLWVLSSVVGIGGICVWAYLRSFVTAKLIPIRDPRIVESLTHHEATAP